MIVEMYYGECATKYIPKMLCEISLTHLCLRVPQNIVVWIYDTFDNKFGIENESYW